MDPVNPETVDVQLAAEPTKTGLEHETETAVAASLLTANERGGLVAEAPLLSLTVYSIE
jgi:hypothetical protein